MDAILTTDLVEKWAWRALEGEVATPAGGAVDPEANGTMLGLAKGSGMIAPNMATMLGFVVTDLDASGTRPPRDLLKDAADVSFKPHDRGRRHEHERHARAHGERRELP